MSTMRDARDDEWRRLGGGYATGAMSQAQAGAARFSFALLSQGFKRAPSYLDS